MTDRNLDSVRESVLDQMERSERLVKGAIFAAALLELALFLAVFTLIDWADRVQRLIFVTSILSYTVVAVGMVALGAHVSRTVGRVLAALGPSGER